MRHSAQVLFVFSVAAIGTAAFASPRNADAFTQYTNTAAAGRCSVVSTSTGIAAFENGQLVNNGAASTAVGAVCAAIDSTALPMRNMTHLSIDTYNQAGSPNFAGAAACVQDNVDEGATCGTVLNGSTSIGHHALGPSTSVWTSATAGYPFIAVVIPGNESAFMGFSITN